MARANGGLFTHTRHTYHGGTPHSPQRPWSRTGICGPVVIVAAMLLTWVAPHLMQAKTIHCGATDTQCLIDSIAEANASGQKNEIRLEAGVYTLVDIDNSSASPNGLPLILGELTIQGAGPEDTIIELITVNQDDILATKKARPNLLLKKVDRLRRGRSRTPGAGIGNGGILTIINSTVADNETPANGCGGGGGISNSGTLTITNSTLAHNMTNSHAGCGGGGIRNSGTVTITNSTLADNVARGDSEGGGIENNFGTITITNSTLAHNVAGGNSHGGGISNWGTLTIINSTLAENMADAYSGGGGRDGGGGISNAGTLTIINSTLAENMAGGNGGGIFNRVGGSVALQNTILALNTTGGTGPDCVGPITSLGNNLIGDLTGCTMTLQPTDLTGNPGLDEFIDEGAPGTGYFPLLPTSRAIDAGNEAACPKTDQLGEHRNKPCDIGAIEFEGMVVSSQ